MNSVKTEQVFERTQFKLLTLIMHGQQVLSRETLCCHVCGAVRFEEEAARWEGGRTKEESVADEPPVDGAEEEEDGLTMRVTPLFERNCFRCEDVLRLVELLLTRFVFEAECGGAPEEDPVFEANWLAEGMVAVLAAELLVVLEEGAENETELEDAELAPPPLLVDIPLSIEVPPPRLMLVFSNS